MRWNDYKTFRMSKSLPVVRFETLFGRLWREHNIIRNYTAKSHPKCDKCGLLESQLNRLGESTDPEAVSERKRIAEAQVNKLQLLSSL
eukprot:5165398-Pleurochrysis_carterae.AAC.1